MFYYLLSGKHTKNYGKSPFSTGKSTISMAMFNSYVSLPEGTHIYPLFVSYSYGKWMKMSHLQMIFPAIKLHL